MSRPPRLGLLRNPSFRRLFAATALGALGDRITFLALPLVAIVALDVSEFQVGLLTAATMAGTFIVGLPAGAWVDRVRKRTVLINTDLTRAAALLTIPLAWWADVLAIWMLYAVALVHGVLTVFFDVAYRSYLPHLVGRDNLVEGNSKLQAIRSVTSISGPGVAGPLVGWVGAPVAMLASSIGMASSALFAISIRKREPKPEVGERPRLGQDIKVGLKFVFQHPVLRPTLLGEGIFNLFLVCYQAMLLVFLAREVGLEPFGIGLILTVMGCGSFLGALLATRVSTWIGKGPVIWLAPLVTCPLTALMPLARPGWSVYLATFGLMCLSLGGVIRGVVQASFQQALTPDRLLGRMSATSRLVSSGAMPLGGLLGGASGAMFGATTTLWIGAVGMTLSVLPSFLSPLRTMREFPAEKAAEPAHGAVSTRPRCVS